MNVGESLLEEASALIASAMRLLEACEHEALPLLDHALALIAATDADLGHNAFESLTLLQVIN